MIQVSEFIDDLKKRYGLHYLFHPRSPLRFNGERFPLDEGELKSYEKFIFTLDYLTTKINSECNENLVICVTRLFDSDNLLSNNNKIIDDFNKFNLRHDGFRSFEITQVPDVNDNYFSMHFTSLERSQLKLLLWGHLAKYFSFLDDCIEGNVYIVCPANSTMYHIYDDRGFDFVHYDQPKFLS